MSLHMVSAFACRCYRDRTGTRAHGNLRLTGASGDSLINGIRASYPQHCVGSKILCCYSRAHGYMRHASTLHLSVCVEPIICFNNEHVATSLISDYPAIPASSCVPFESNFHHNPIEVIGGWTFAWNADILSFRC